MSSKKRLMRTWEVMDVLTEGIQFFDGIAPEDWHGYAVDEDKQIRNFWTINLFGGPFDVRGISSQKIREAMNEQFEYGPAEKTHVDEMLNIERGIVSLKSTLEQSGRIAVTAECYLG